MPHGVVPYYTGEHYAYTDFAIACVMSLLFLKGALYILIFYNIFCHWIKTFWVQLALILKPFLPADMQERVSGGVGKYHIFGHTNSCYALYSPNNMFGVGHLNAEGCERAWADLNQVPHSSSEKGPGFCIDSLNNNMHDWNWRKLIGFVSFLLQKNDEAVRMAEQTETEWQEFHSLLPTNKTSIWAKVSTKPYQDAANRNKWTSVFISKEGSSTSITCALIELNQLELKERKGDTPLENGATVADWISDGLDLKYQQQRLVQDVKSFGTDPTDWQSLECSNCQSSIGSWVIYHRQQAALYLNIVPSSNPNSESLAEETDGQPEHTTLYLPSRLGSSLADTDRSRKATNTECKL
ncbi:hypothetical protein FRC08_007206 [Ceratobasidium sp. 394]|nr:hypothetical protein FRC08_007206 [Ceratobasidium sp. 394]